MGLIRSWRRKRRLERHRVDSALWSRVVAAYDFLDDLRAAEQEKLHGLVVNFLAEKELTGAGGMALTDEVSVAIAAQACLPVLELGLDWYEGFLGVVVYPGQFAVRRTELDDDGVMHEWDDELSGEAMPGGPVVLSWEDVGLAGAGYNVVIHEFAHKLDMIHGDADGYPRAHPEMDQEEWHRVLEVTYVRLCDKVDRGRPTPFDEYAAEHPAEFFAVMTEEFFTDPVLLRDEYPTLYRQLVQFYRQDPAARVKRPPAR
jgi:Mlc titration factor MtfA (ptsG expression regulator)